MRAAEELLNALAACMEAEFSGGIDVDEPAALAIIEADRAAAAKAERERLIEQYAPRCRRCQARTEPERWCYATPTCFACLPAPEPLKTVHPLQRAPRRPESVLRRMQEGRRTVRPLRGAAHPRLHPVQRRAASREAAVSLELWNRSRRIAIRAKQAKARREAAEAEWIVMHPPPKPRCTEKPCDYVLRGFLEQCQVCKNWRPIKL